MKDEKIMLLLMQVQWYHIIQPNTPLYTPMFTHDLRSHSDDRLAFSFPPTRSSEIKKVFKGRFFSIIWLSNRLKIGDVTKLIVTNHIIISPDNVELWVPVG